MTWRNIGKTTKTETIWNLNPWPNECPFEELKWTTGETCREFFIEMVLDRSGKNDKDLKPAKDATVKRVNMGRDTSGSIQNMPEGRSFLVRVVGKLPVGKEVYSAWTRAITLSPKTRDKDLGNLDPMNMPRTSPVIGLMTCSWLEWDTVVIRSLVELASLVIGLTSFNLGASDQFKLHVAKAWTATIALVRVLSELPFWMPPLKGFVTLAFVSHLCWADSSDATV